MNLGLSSFVNEFRCTARLLIHELDNPRSQVIDCVDEICKLFEGGTYANTYSVTRANAFKLLFRQELRGAVRQVTCSRWQSLIGSQETLTIWRSKFAQTGIHNKPRGWCNHVLK